MHPQAEMRLCRRLVAAALSGMLATSSLAPLAVAQPKAGASATSTMTPKQKREAARKHYSAGMSKLEAKDYKGALEEFQAANAVIPSPQAQEKMAMCYDGMGKVLEAIAAYTAFVDAAGDNPKLAADVAEAEKRLAALQKTPMEVKIASEPSSATVEVDGKAQMGATPVVVSLAPGKHKIKVSAPGHKAMEREIEVKLQEPLTELTFALEAEPPAPAPTPVAPPSAGPEAAPQPAPSRSKVPAYVTLGVAGASAIVGTVFGVKALGDKKDFDDKPTVDKADDAERNALIADMAFGVAVTLGVTGVVLLLNDGGEASPAAAQQEGAKKSMHLTPYVSPYGGGAAASWRF